MFARLAARSIKKQFNAAPRQTREHIVKYSGQGLGPLVKRDMIKVVISHHNGTIEMRYEDPSYDEMHTIYQRRKYTKPLQ